MNPFELRFNIFNVAKEMLEKQYEANLAAWQLLDKTSKEVSELAPQYPTLPEVVEKAIEINRFVSSNTEKELANVVKRMSGVSVIF